MARLPALFGHAMPRGYAESLISMISEAGLTDVREEATNFAYLAFLHAKRS